MKWKIAISRSRIHDALGFDFCARLPVEIAPPHLPHLISCCCCAVGIVSSEFCINTLRCITFYQKRSLDNPNTYLNHHTEDGRLDVRQTSHFASKPPSRTAEPPSRNPAELPDFQFNIPNLPFPPTASVRGADEGLRMTIVLGRCHRFEF